MTWTWKMRTRQMETKRETKSTAIYTITIVEVIKHVWSWAHLPRMVCGFDWFMMRVVCNLQCECSQQVICVQWCWAAVGRICRDQLTRCDECELNGILPRNASSFKLNRWVMNHDNNHCEYDESPNLWRNSLVDVINGYLFSLRIFSCSLVDCVWYGRHFALVYYKQAHTSAYL